MDDGGTPACIVRCASGATSSHVLFSVTKHNRVDPSRGNSPSRVWPILACNFLPRFRRSHGAYRRADGFVLPSREAGPSRAEITVFAEHHVDQGTITIDRAIEIPIPLDGTWSRPGIYRMVFPRFED